MPPGRNLGISWVPIWCSCLSLFGGLLLPHWGLVGAHWVLLGALRVRLVASWVPLGAEGSDFRFAFPLLGTFWVPLGLHRNRHGRLLGRLGVISCRLGVLLGASWAVLGRSWEPLGPSWSVGSSNKREPHKHVGVAYGHRVLAEACGWGALICAHERSLPVQRPGCSWMRVDGVFSHGPMSGSDLCSAQDARGC